MTAFAPSLELLTSLPLLLTVLPFFTTPYIRLKMVAPTEDTSAKYIADWQERADDTAESNAPDHDLSEPISRLYSNCLALFRMILREIKAAKSISKLATRSLERNFADLALWGADFEVATGALDRRLDRSHSLRRFTLRLFLTITKALSPRMYGRINFDI